MLSSVLLLQIPEDLRSLMVAAMNCPCYQCEYRHTGCAVECQIYHDWKAEIEKRKKQNIVQGYLNEQLSKHKKKYNRGY